MFPFESNEPGDLNFGIYEVIEVLDLNDDWFTGRYVNIKTDEEAKGIFPSNYVRKLDFPADYLNKNNLAIVIQDYNARTNEELTVRTHDLIAISHLSPDQLWSFAETYVSWFKASQFNF